MTTKDQRVYPTRTADRCSDCPPAGYPTEKTRCYGCPLANTYKDATGELVIPTAAPSSKTDLEFVLTALRHALGGMRAVQEHAPQGTAAARYANELEQAIGIIERMRQDETTEAPDINDIFRAGVTQAKYRMHYKDALTRILASDRMISHDIAQAALDASPEEPTAEHK